MSTIGFQAKLVALIVLAGLIGGCAKARIRYEPNRALRSTARFGKTLVVVGFSDSRPEWEKTEYTRNATCDYRCIDNVPEALAVSVQRDIAAAGVFEKVVLRQKEADVSADADAVLYGDVRHLYGRFHENWMKFPAACFMFIGAPFYIAYEYADFQVEIHLKVLDAKTAETLW